MSIITMKKIIAIVLIAIMVVTMTMPVFGASNASKIKTIKSIFKKATEHMKKVITIVSEILNPGGGEGSGGEEPIITTKSMNTIAKECKKVLRVNGFTYQTVSYNYQTNPPSANSSTKKIDCSGYVSWVIYEYAKQKGNTTVQNAFKNNKSSSEIKTYMDNNTSYFSKVGKLSNLTSSDLKAGDIIVKSGHVEIFGKYDSTVTNKYRCYNAGSSDAISSGGNSGELTGGACNSGTSNYTVYRVKF